MKLDELDYDALSEDLLDILQSESTSHKTEYEVLKILREQHPFFPSPENHLQLFQQHFVIFHCLYRLQQLLWESRQGHLLISALEIKIEPYTQGEAGSLRLPDPLRTYYLDLSQLDTIQQKDVEELIGSFWERLAMRDQRKEALAILDLADPVSDKTIKYRYRELVMTHHPDRGGDKLRLQLINAALADLLPKPV